MLTQLQVFSLGEAVSPLPFVGTSIDTDRIQIQNIDGLGPVSAEILTAKAVKRGEIYNGFNVGKRVITITVGYNPLWANIAATGGVPGSPTPDLTSPEGLRQTLYRTFMPGQKIRMRFTGTHLIGNAVDIYGYTESVEPNIFSKDPQVVITIVCPDPDFIAINPTVLNFATIPLGAGSYSTAGVYLYGLSTGFVMKVTTNTSYAGTWNFIRSSTTQIGGLADVMVLDNALANPLSPSTTFEWSTIPGNKYARWTDLSSAPPVNALSQITPTSRWFNLDHGNNYLNVFGPTGGNVELTYTERFGGL